MRAAAHLAGERRVVTALFADVVGSTALAEQMDPEEWTVVMNHALDALVPAIYHYEGTIARLMGDALLAFFGAPVAHEDDPVRAVHAGLDLLAEVTAGLGEEAQAEVYRGQAREIIEFIAEHAGRAELRDSFLGLPEVRGVYLEK